MARMLTFPLVWLLDALPDRNWGESALAPAIFAVNSLLWGAAVYFGFVWLRRVIRARRPQADSPAPNS